MVIENQVFKIYFLEVTSDVNLAICLYKYLIKLSSEHKWLVKIWSVPDSGSVISIGFDFECIYDLFTSEEIMASFERPFMIFATRTLKFPFKDCFRFC